MTYKLIVTVIFIMIIKQVIPVTTNDTDSEESAIEENNLEKPTMLPSAAEEETSSHTLHSLEDETQNTTSQDRISYHNKRGAPKYSSVRYPYHHGSSHRHHRQPPLHYAYRGRPVSYPKLRKKHQRSRRRPGFPPPIIQAGPPITLMGKLQYPKMAYKRTKPILLSEVIRSGPSHPYAKFKPTAMGAGPPGKEYMEQPDLEASPFSSVGADSMPSVLNKFGRPPLSIEMSGEIHDALPPVGAIEEEIFYPGGANSKPFPGAIMKKPASPQIYSLTKPPDVYVDEELQDNIRNVRLATKAPSGYVDQDVISLLQKIKQEGVHLESSKPTETTVSYTKDNMTDMNNAISKLLLPFLSETAVKKIQSYVKNLPREKQHKEDEKNLTKVVYIVEDQDREFSKKNSNETSIASYKTYSVTQPIKDSDKNSTTYFIMLKSPADGMKNLNFTATSILQSLKHQSKRQEHTTKQPETKTTTLPSLQNLALQHYIMSLAGIGLNQQREQNYLPRFNSFNKQSRSYY